MISEPESSPRAGSPVRLPIQNPWTRLALVDPAGKRSAMLVADSEHGGQLFINDTSETLTAVLGTRENGGTLGLYKKTGGSAVELTTTKDGGNLSIRNKAGKLAALLGSTESGGIFAVLDKAQKPAAGLIATGDGGRIGIYDKAGKIVAETIATEWGGRLNLYDRAKKTVATVNPDLIGIFSKTNTWRPVAKLCKGENGLCLMRPPTSRIGATRGEPCGLRTTK